MKIRQRPARMLIIVAVLALAVGTGFAVYFSNAQPASAEALAAMQSTNAVTVTDTSQLITFMPTFAPRAGLIFYPGARVAPEAYAARLAPVAGQGYAVFIVKFPLNLAVFGVSRAGDIIAAHPQIRKWALGGHSLGGAFAGSFLEGRTDVTGLILYASYPAGDLAKRTDLVAVSIYGTRDGLATVEKVKAARLTMPPQTQYVPIEGGIHSFFGDYGLQAGDGIPSTSREVAASQIVTATIAAMDAVAGR